MAKSDSVASFQVFCLRIRLIEVFHITNIFIYIIHIAE